ncbi:hypothetical protein PVAND_001554 [Polypedilum vanderplanki]|uniref:ZAD domain-containing protein n=1 Tax=Polypedilum vanderplanki TaxID=319348 RepID=A0A9J6BNA4_POLVA|nr:hypothetical protein PVAND_001554 [Polypedilum vanderplanki]
MQSINVLERFDFHLCSVCTISSASLYFNIFQNVISFRNNLFSFSQIIQDTLGLKLDEKNQSHEICVHCKETLVKFFIFKKTNEETRKNFNRSAEIENTQKELILQEVQIGNSFEDENYCEEEISDNLSDIGGHQDELTTSIAPIDSHDNILELNESHLTQDYEIKTSPRTKVNSEKWKRNKRKLAKNSGKSYVSSKNKFVNAKEMKSNCGTCRLKCTKYLNEEQRLNNFKNFYALADIRQQRKFLFEHMKSFMPKKRSSSKSNRARNVQRNFYLELRNENGNIKMIHVCKRMFLNTLSISSQMIDTLQRKITIEQGKIEDLRGKYKRKKFNNK